MGKKRSFAIATPLLLLSLPVSIHAAELVIGDTVTTGGNWSTTGNVTALSFTGNGSGLSNVSAASLSCVNCIGPGQLSFNPGTIMGIVTGTGLTGGGNNGEVTLSVAPGGIGTDQINPAQVQTRVSGTCTSDQYIQAINQNGSVTCGSGLSGGISLVNSGAGLTGGPITSSGTLSVDFGGSGSATTVSRSDHNHDSIYQKKYARVLAVEGDHSSLVSAMNSITDASDTKRYLIKIMPGTYDLSYAAGSTLEVKRYVDIEGSGEGNTRVISTNPLYGVFIAYGDQEIRSLSIESRNNYNQWGPSQGDGIYALGPNVEVSNVKITLTTDAFNGYHSGISGATTLNNVSINATSTNYSQVNGIRIRHSGIEANNTVINASSSGTGEAYGLYLEGGSGRFANLTVNASAAQYAVLATGGAMIDILSSSVTGNVESSTSGGTLRIESSSVTGNTSAPGGAIKLGNSRVSGITASGGRIKAVNCYNGSFDPIANGSY
ncbi:hypothetical protein [Geobacter sp. DSM 9736]|uniref:hypothetical protein n=1 Tax=Geobacter sp. DSM 9736 TaxID=1277350 RepID=UPI000B511238|nr:hypothetical protein [Geobacter sp. DSM 9736]SNB46259.1 hypothetical protein SAMN06269301_1704 [Geobacter sp. DSM 9736]